jgi:hypothetical protein
MNAFQRDGNWGREFPDKKPMCGNPEMTEQFLINGHSYIATK